MVLEDAGQKIWLVLTCWVVLAVGLVVLVAAVVGLRAWLFRRRQRAAEEVARRARLGPDGQNLPPAAPGFCDLCGRPFDRVYHLPDGTRRCPDCHQREQTASTGEQESRKT